MMRYTYTMVWDRKRFKCIVAALFVGVSLGLSQAALAQNAPNAQIAQWFADLQTATPAQTLQIENQILSEWGKSGSAAIDLLLRRGNDALQDGDAAAALDHFSALVDHAPAFAEGYYARATAFYMLDDTGPALADLEMALALNPQHFEAMRGVAAVMEQIGRPAQALDLYRMILEMMPQSELAQDDVARLLENMEGLAL